MKSLLLVATFVVVICLGTGSYIKKRKIIEKKDDYQECSAKEATKLKWLITKSLNADIKEENKEMEQMNAFLMPSESLERGQIKIVNILSCQLISKENTEFSFKIEADAVEDGQKQKCLIEGIHGLDNNVQIDQNQCQGQD